MNALLRGGISLSSKDPNYAAAHNNLGTLFDHLGEFEAAVSAIAMP